MKPSLGHSEVMPKPTATGARTAAPHTSASVGEDARPQSLRQPNLLAGLTTSDRQLVVSLARRRHVDPGGIVFGHGDPHDAIYLIESGLVRTFYSSPSGREITLAYWTDGNLVGAPQMFGCVAIDGDAHSRRVHGPLTVAVYCDRMGWSSESAWAGHRA
jgi:hypothetical protein